MSGLRVSGFPTLTAHSSALDTTVDLGSFNGLYTHAVGDDTPDGFPVWRTASERRLNVSLVHMPEKGWIWPWFSPKIAAPRQSSRAILMHKVTPQLLPEVTSTWRVRKPAPPDLYVDCSQSCTQWRPTSC